MLIHAATVVHRISTHAYHAFPCYLHRHVKHQSMEKHGKDGDSMKFPWNFHAFHHAFSTRDDNSRSFPYKLRKPLHIFIVLFLFLFFILFIHQLVALQEEVKMMGGHDHQ